MSGGTRVSEYAADTMALVLRMEGRRLGATARAVFDAADRKDATVYVPGMVLAEIMYLSAAEAARRLNLTW